MIFSRPQHIEPQPGQESVWDYPRPPRLDPCEHLIEVIFNGVTIARTNRSIRVLETSHPPTYYIPPEDVDPQYLELNPHQSFCEWKGQARYHNVVVSNAAGEIRRADQAVWSYPNRYFFANKH